MNRMRIFTLVGIFVIVCISLHAQYEEPPRQQFLRSFGIEGGGQTGNIFISSADEFRGSIFGLTGAFALKLPQFSFGTGLQIAAYAKINEFSYTGEFDVDPDGTVLYLHDRMSRRFSYLSVPLRIQYSFNCDCAFLQVGLQPGILFEELAQETPVLTEQIQGEAPFGSTSSFNTAIELGAGFRLYFTENIRLQLQPTFVRLLFPYYDLYGENYGYSFLRVTFGLQYALFEGG